MGHMGITEKAKEFTDVALQKAGALSETAREKAPGVIDKAADVTVKAMDAAASGIDRVTGGRFHDKLEGAAAKVEKGLDRSRPDGSATTTAKGAEEPGRSTGSEPTAAPTGTATSPPSRPTGPTATTPGATGQNMPTTPATTNPDATGPGTSKP